MLLLISRNRGKSYFKFFQIFKNIVFLVFNNAIAVVVVVEAETIFSGLFWYWNVCGSTKWNRVVKWRLRKFREKLFCFNLNAAEIWMFVFSNLLFKFNLFVSWCQSYKIRKFFLCEIILVLNSVKLYYFHTTTTMKLPYYWFKFK